jgi:hypothetical protein
VNVRAAKSSFDGATLAVITATLTDSDTASAEGISVTSASPVLTLCRELIKAGYDPGLPLIAMRGQIVCLKVRSIGQAAKLSVTPNGVGFEPFRAGPQSRSSSTPIAPNAPGRAEGYVYVESPRNLVPESARRARRKVAS